MVQPWYPIMGNPRRSTGRALDDLQIAHRFWTQNEFCKLLKSWRLVRPGVTQTASPCVAGRVGWAKPVILQHGLQPKGTFRPPIETEVLPKSYSFFDHFAQEQHHPLPHPVDIQEYFPQQEFLEGRPAAMATVNVARENTGCKPPWVFFPRREPILLRTAL